MSATAQAVEHDWSEPTIELRITDAEFAQIRNLVYRLAGIHLNDSKKGLVVSRLGRRLREFGLRSFGDYYELVNAGGLRHDERQIMLDLITTNETSFFREEKHFAYLAEAAGEFGAETIGIWSAACSTGEEPYSIAMTLAGLRPLNRFSVLGTDVSHRVLEVARTGVYPLERAQRIPPELLSRYCLKGVRSQAGKFMIDAALRSRVEFRSLNLNGQWPDLGPFHLVFLRNVMIYFDVETKRRLIGRIAQRLHPGGYLFVGHSESINGLHDGLATVAPSVYRLR